MSKYVKEMMMDQLKTELDGDRSVLILDLKGLDAITEYQFRRDLRKLCRVARRQRHLCSCLGEGYGAGPTDTLACAGDHGHPAMQ